MSDSLTDAQKIICDVLDRLNVGSYTDHAHLAVEIDKALGGLTREIRHTPQPLQARVREVADRIAARFGYHHEDRCWDDE